MKLSIKLPDSLILLAFMLFMPNDARSEKPDVNGLQSQQRQLESLLNELKESSQHRQKANDRLKQLRHKLDCNWTLIQTYETCGQKYKDSPNEFLKCSTAAKDNAQKCISLKPPEQDGLE